MNQKTSYEQMKDDIAKVFGYMPLLMLIFSRLIYYVFPPVAAVAFAWFMFGGGLVDLVSIWIPRIDQ